jgi:hypothetical protein
MGMGAERERQASAEIEVTPEMVAAGVRVFEEWEDSEDASARNLVTRIYREMKAREDRHLDQCTPEGRPSASLIRDTTALKRHK